MDYFTANGKISYAIRAFAELCRWKTTDISTKEVVHRCANLLKLDYVYKDSESTNFRILPRLLELGLVPNLLLHNIVIANAFRSSSPTVAWDIFDFMQKQGVQPDSHTYISLLKDVVQRRDVRTFENLRNTIQQQTHLRNESHLVSYILYGHLVLYDADRHEKTRAFADMLSVFGNSYDLSGLAQLGMLSLDLESPIVESSRTPPSVFALNIMIRAYLGIAVPRSMIDLYDRFQKLVSMNDPIIMPLTRTDHTYNAFSVNFARHKETFSLCGQIIQDMLRNASKSTAPSQLETDSPEQVGHQTQHVKPTTQTWNILLLSFVLNGRNRSAGKICDMMRDQGIAPDRVTYNILIKGHAMKQQVSLAVEVLAVMNRAQLEADGYTIGALSNLQDKSQLKERLDLLEEAAAGDERPRPQRPERESSEPASGDEKSARGFRLRKVEFREPVITRNFVGRERAMRETEYDGSTVTLTPDEIRAKM